MEITAVEKELLDLIVKHLQENKIKALDAQNQAKEFLSLLPITDQSDLLSKLKALGDKYEESGEVYLTELQKQSENERQKALNEMRSHIQTGNIEAAINVAKSNQKS
jgi:uncharacterized protein YaaR (DUF327 family)